MALHSISSYEAVLIPLAVPDAAIDALLPRGLVRAPQSTTPPGTHPVLLPLARNFDTRPSWPPLFRLDYLEYSVVVPYITRTGSTTPLTYIPILFLNRWFPIIFGRLAYGFPKIFANIETVQPHYAAHRSSGATLVEADLVPSGAPLPPASYPHFGDIAAMLRFPIVSHWMGLVYVCSTMDWGLDTVARLRPVSGELRMTADFFPNLERADYAVEGIDRGPLGAFHLTTTWTLSLPHRCPD